MYFLTDEIVNEEIIDAAGSIIDEATAIVAENIPEEATDFLTWLLNLLGVANTGEVIEILGVVCIAVMAFWKLIPFVAKFFPALGEFKESIDEKVAANGDKVEGAVTTFKQIAETTNSKLATQETELGIVMKAVYALATSSSISADGKKIVIECFQDFDKLKNDNTRTNYVAAQQADEAEELLAKADQVIQEQVEKDAKAEERINVVDAISN